VGIKEKIPPGPGGEAGGRGAARVTRTMTTTYLTDGRTLKSGRCDRPGRLDPDAGSQTNYDPNIGLPTRDSAARRLRSPADRGQADHRI